MISNLFSQKENRIVVAMLATIVFAIIYFQALNPLWKGHLEVDTWIWYQRVEYFYKNNFSFVGLKNSEFLPATLLFLFAPIVFLNSSSLNYSSYLKGALCLNLFILFFHFCFYKKERGSLQAIFFLIILLSLGPIMLFRFDGFVTLLILLTLWFWRKKNFSLSGFFFGWATAIKVFPVIFLPYFLLVLRSDKKQRLQIIPFLLFFIIAGFLSLLIFFLIGGSVEQVFEALGFHSLKYVSIESVPGVFLTGASLLVAHKPLTLVRGYGVWGINSELINILGLNFFNYLWMLPIFLFYLFLTIKKEFTKNLNIGVLFCLTILFLVFSKNLHPQYIFWFIALFPFLKVKEGGEFDYFLMFFFIIIISFLNQNVYPLLYTNFLEQFYSRGKEIEIFYLQFLRNLSIILLLIFSFKAIFLKKSLE